MLYNIYNSVDLVVSPPPVSGCGLCSVCFTFYWLGDPLGLAGTGGVFGEGTN